MSESYQKDDLKKIENLHSDIKDWLKFSESKNAALLTFNAAFLFGVLRLAGDESVIPKTNFTLIIIFLIFISIGVNLISFFPKKVKNKVRTLGNYRVVNLLYFSNIAKLGLKSTEDYLANKYYGKLNTNPYFADLATQIYSLAVITDRKNTYFKVSLIISITTFFLLGFNIIL